MKFSKEGPMGRAVFLSLFAAVAACAPQIITVDPGMNPAVSGAAMAQPMPPIQGQMDGAPVAPLAPIGVLRADFAARAGSTIVRFDGDSHLVDAEARQILSRQADWLRINPMVRASIEGHADGRQTRDQALALGERRAYAVLGVLLSLGVSPTQLSVTSWGKERPLAEGAHEATFLQNSRVETVLAR